jgi:hypothetical protein
MSNRRLVGVADERQSGGRSINVDARVRSTRSSSVILAGSRASGAATDPGLGRR